MSKQIMRIRDGLATINGDKTEYKMPSNSIEIIADDGKTLFAISFRTESDVGAIRVHAGTFCKHGGMVFDDRLVVIPVASNAISIARVENKPSFA